MPAKNILKVRTVGDFNRSLDYPEQHPLVSVIDFEEASPVPHTLNQYSVYGIFFHDEAQLDLDYGCGRYDYQAGTVICVAPGQIGGHEDNGERMMLTGWALLFHPDLLQGTPLEKNIKHYSFLDYRINEALHMSPDEQRILIILMQRIKEEVQQSPDEVQKAVLVGYVELVLNYCLRFYNRQFLTRKVENNDALTRFEALLHSYYEEKLQFTLGVPTIKYCADRLCMSPNYFGDLVKSTAHDSPSNYIRQFLVQRAKNLLAHGTTIAEVAYALGFEYPHHFTRMFKAQTGLTPSAYVQSLHR